MTTVRELRAFLDAEEAKWTEKDLEYLGPFGDQGLFVLLAQGSVARLDSPVHDACFGIVLNQVTK